MTAEDPMTDSGPMSWLDSPTTDEDLHDPWDSIIISEEETILRGRPRSRGSSSTKHSKAESRKLALAIHAVSQAKDAMNETLGVMRDTIVALRKATDRLYQINSYEKLADVSSKRKRQTE